MKKLGIISVMTAVCLLSCIALVACSAAPDKGAMSPSSGIYDDGSIFVPDAVGGAGDSLNEGNNYVYGEVTENGFVNADETPSSYFSLDRNTAGYSLVRNQINNGRKISPTSVRIEEMVNYFDYNLPRPEEKGIGICSGIIDCPWNSENKLVMLGVTTAEQQMDYKNGNYVFLIDVSGSMSASDRIGLAKQGMCLLVDSLGEGDVVSIVTYASGIECKMDGIECTSKNKSEIKSKINALRASGATNGEGGLQLAYETAQKHFISDGNNRVILISDGDFNVGMSNTEQMKNFISEKAKSGVYLSVFGVGMGNMRDDMMETLANNGNGNYAYIDSYKEAEKAFVHDIVGNMITVAKDAKAGITFNENVESYRLIGYDTKHITAEDFENYAKDTGDIGSGFSVGIIYEIKLKDNDYQGAVAEVEVRYKDVRGETEFADSCKVTVDFTKQPEYENDAFFAACVAEFGLILRNSEYKAQASLASVLERLESLTEYIANDEYKAEFVELVKKAILSEFYI